jgi:acetyl-CoA synthetase
LLFSPEKTRGGPEEATMMRAVIQSVVALVLIAAESSAFAPSARLGVPLRRNDLQPRSGPSVVPIVGPGSKRPDARRSATLLRMADAQLDTEVGQEGSFGNIHQTFPPPSGLKGAYVDSIEQYQKMYDESIKDPDAFWGKIADEFHWEKKWDKISDVNFDLDKGPVSIKWFLGAKTNLAYNCVDRHVKAGNGDRVAFLWEGNDGEEKKMTYKELLDEVSKTANMLKSLGVKKGDNVAIYLPMIMELPISMLACARIGAVHSVVFGGFSAESLASRAVDCQAKVIITADGAMRGKKPIKLFDIAKQAIEEAKGDGHIVETCVVVERLGSKVIDMGALPPYVKMWEDLVGKQSTDCPVEWMDSEDPLFLLYTSGSTGKPKGVLHTTGGYMVWSTTTFKYVFDYKPDDVFWCTADCGWITGHSYVTYGPTAMGATQILFEGVPTYPTVSRCWDIIQKYKVTQFYTAPTLIRSLQSFGEEPLKDYDLSSLKILGSVNTTLSFPLSISSLSLSFSSPLPPLPPLRN